MPPDRELESALRGGGTEPKPAQRRHWQRFRNVRHFRSCSRASFPTQRRSSWHARACRRDRVQCHRPQTVSSVPARPSRARELSPACHFRAAAGKLAPTTGIIIALPPSTFAHHTKSIVGILKFRRNAGSRRAPAYLDVMPPRAAARRAPAPAFRSARIVLG